MAEAFESAASPSSVAGSKGVNVEIRRRSSLRSIKAGVEEAGTKETERTGTELSQETRPHTPACRGDPMEEEEAVEDGLLTTGNPEVAWRKWYLRHH
jgi:hypothetical protein